MKTKVAFAAILLLIGLSSAYGQQSWPTSDWPRSTPEAQGIDSVRLTEMLGEVLKKNIAIDALLVIRDGRLVLESYRYPNTSTTLHSIYSCTKSFISALIGIALEQGKLKNVQQQVVDFFSDYRIVNLDKAKKDMTLRDLLTMSSGFRWLGGMPEEPTFDEWTGSSDWVGYVLDRPLETAPGTRFTYNSGGSHLLSAILQRSVGMTAEAFARQYLFQPLGITDWYWQSDPQGVSTGGFGLQLRPLDMARLGYLYLHHGNWNNRQVVPAQWCSESVKKQIAAGGQWLSDGYGYQWWVDDQGYYMALGYGGQHIIVVPNQQLVVVVTSHLSTYEFFLPERLFQNYILPACTSSGALPPNDAAVKFMNSQIQQLIANPNDMVTRQ